MNKKLRELFVLLDIPTSRLYITDEETGAGYITYYGDNVFARWTTYQQGIALLQQYLSAPPINEYE